MTHFYSLTTQANHLMYLDELKKIHAEITFEDSKSDDTTPNQNYPMRRRPSNSGGGGRGSEGGGGGMWMDGYSDSEV
jgi:hypothetical protein